MPGAIAATAVWFPATLAFGWYVTRIADYSMFYGSFGAGIATLVWLYITAFSVLIGAELNGALFRERQARRFRSRNIRFPTLKSVTGLTDHCMHRHKMHDGIRGDCGADPPCTMKRSPIPLTLLP